MPAKSQIATSDVAETLIRKTGARVTSARVQILKILLNSERALSHNEIETRLGRNNAIDRVTVYRVLEWLTDSGVAHKLTDPDRVWRFNVSAKGGNHPHFVCTCCKGVFCLENAGAPRAPKLPGSFRATQVELTVHGLCSDCSASGHSPSSHNRARRRAG